MHWHRSFKTSRPLRAVFAVLGSAAVEGPVIEWVSSHRKHHRFSDLPVTRIARMSIMVLASPAGSSIPAVG
jgi:hypothetical protein